MAVLHRVGGEALVVKLLKPSAWMNLEKNSLSFIVQARILNRGASP